MSRVRPTSAQASAVMSIGASCRATATTASAASGPSPTDTPVLRTWVVSESDLAMFHWTPPTEAGDRVALAILSHI